MLDDLRHRLPPLDRRSVVRAVALSIASVAVASLAVALLEGPGFGLRDASPVYLVAVVLVGAALGTGAAVGTAVAAVLTFDFLFTEPLYTFAVADPEEWLDLVLFLVVAVVVGRLSAVGAERGRQAASRATVASALFAISRRLAVAPNAAVAASDVVTRLASDAGLRRVWIALGDAGDRVLSDTDAGTERPAAAISLTLARTPGDQPARWVRAHEPRASRPVQRASDDELLRVRIEVDGVGLGWLLATRSRASRPPDRDVTRLLSLAADQVGLALRRDQLLRESTELEVTRRSEALRSALLDSVTHDLRTPLASIRAAAGSLADPDQSWPDDARRATATAIDAEAERLDRIVTGVLDLSRIEAGALRPQREAFELAEVVETVVDRWRPRLDGRPIELRLADDLPPVEADGRFLDSILANLLDNAVRYAPPPAPIEISTRSAGKGWIELLVEDGGPGVSVELLPRLFEKFYRAPGGPLRSRPGIGIGLSLVRGFAEAMGGRVEARRSTIGGLAISVVLPEATPPSTSEEAAQTADARAGGDGR